MKIKLVDVDNRLSIKYNKIDGIYNWGDDNCYPQLVKSLIGTSVTAKQCRDLCSKNLYGKGFDFTQNVADKKSLIVNKDGLTINKLLRNVSLEFSEQNNVFLHVNYNALYEITSVELISCEDVRIGKSDSTGYSGKFVVYDNWDKSKGKKIEKKDFNIIDRFNPLPSVIEAQVELSGGWHKYKGQILHLTSDFNQHYSLSDVDCALKDADSEYLAAEYKNGILRKGFAGVKMVITKPMKDGEERRDLDSNLKNIQGVENMGVVHLEANAESDNLNEQILIQDLTTSISDKLFESTEQSTAKNIRKAFGIPAILIEDSDNSIFGNSGELLVQAKLMLWENKEEERNIITEAFELLFSNFSTNINPTNNWSIVPTIQKNKPINE